MQNLNSNAQSESQVCIRVRIVPCRTLEKIPLISLISCSLKILVFLLLCHSTPPLLPYMVPPYVIVLSKNDNHDVQREDSQHDSVTAAVVWLIVISIDLYLLICTPNKKSYGEPTFDEMMLLAWTNMLNSAVPTVRVRTEPALRLTEATIKCEVIDC